MNLSVLPNNLQFPKPHRVANLDEMRRLRAEGKLSIQRKRDGARVAILVTPEGEVKLYARTLQNYTDKFPQVVEAFKALNLPGGTLIDGELVLGGVDGADNFNSINGMTHASAQHAIDMQRFRRTVPVFLVFDLLYLAGQPCFHLPYRHRFQTIQSFNGVHPLIAAVRDLGCSVDEAIELVVANKWEGLVFWRLDQGTKMGFGSTPPRANCYKWKLPKEDDFVAVGFEMGEGRFSDRVGALQLVEYRDGKPFSVGGVGTGFSEQQRLEMLSWTFPCVVEVRYDERTPDGKLRFPRFYRRRDDKTVAEMEAA